MTGVIQIAEIVKIVGEYYDVLPDQITGPLRCRSITRARWVAIYLVRKFRRLSLKQIGQRFGHRDHTTILNALRHVQAESDADYILCAQIGYLVTKITQLPLDDFWIWAA